MTAFLKLIRWPNLLIVAFTQWLVRYCMFKPLLSINNMELQMNVFDFTLIMLSTVLIAAGGYIINDYFDVRIDSINNTHENVIDKKGGIKRRWAIILHWLLSINGVLIGIALGIKYGMWKLGLINFLIAAGLWFYSTTLKRKLIFGNVLIACFTALVPLIPAIYELRLDYLAYETPISEDLFIPLWKWTIGLCTFAFLANLMREIIKDIEDIEGDKAFGCSTLPIAWGITQAKAIAAVYGVLLSIGVAYVQMLQYKSGDYISLGYFMVLIQLPVIFTIYKVIAADKTKEYTMASKLLKYIMFFGISYLILYTLLVNNGMAVYH